MLARWFRATAVEEDAGAPDTIVIRVPTPLAVDGAPDLTAVRGAVLSYHDPYVAERRVDEQAVRRAADVSAEVPPANLVILLQDHAACDLDRTDRDAQLLLDTRGRLAVPIHRCSELA